MYNTNRIDVTCLLLTIKLSHMFGDTLLKFYVEGVLVSAEAFHSAFVNIKS